MYLLHVFIAELGGGPTKSNKQTKKTNNNYNKTPASLGLLSVSLSGLMGLPFRDFGPDPHYLASAGYILLQACYRAWEP